MTNSLKHIALILSAAALCACSTSGKIPDGFGDVSGSSGKYPKASQAPLLPTDIRSDRDWDIAARSIISVRESFKAPAEARDEYKSEAEIYREMEALKAKVDEYKLDDPVE